MERLASVLAAALLAGCSTHYQVNASSGMLPPGGVAPGTTASGGTVQVQTGGSAAAALLAIGVLAGAAAMGPAPARAPELAPGRRVNEQDCTRPIADGAANLRCR